MNYRCNQNQFHSVTMNQHHPLAQFTRNHHTEEKAASTRSRLLRKLHSWRVQVTCLLTVLLVACGVGLLALGFEAAGMAIFFSSVLVLVAIYAAESSGCFSKALEDQEGSSSLADGVTVVSTLLEGDYKPEDAISSGVSNTQSGLSPGTECVSHTVGNTNETTIPFNIEENAP